MITISASQISTFRDCPRKWAFDKIDSVPRAETEATNAGKAIHDEIEAWYKHGTTPLKRESKALLQHLPPRGEGLLVEWGFEFAWPGIEAIAHGFVDLVDLNTNTVYDHKTTKNLARYAKSPETLAEDPQQILYGVAHRVLNRPSDSNVRLQWTYVERESTPRPDRAPKTNPVSRIQDLSEVESGLRLLTPVVEEIVQIRKSGKKAPEVRHDTGACYKYGKCHYRDLCPDFAGSKSTTKEAPMTLSAETLARLAAASTKPPDVAVVAEAAPKPAPTVAEAGPPKMGLLDTARIDLGVRPAVLPPDAQPNQTPEDPPMPDTIPEKTPRKTRTTKSAIDPRIEEAIEAGFAGNLDQRLKAAELLLLSKAGAK